MAKKTEEKKHALLSASSSSRWLACTPSARMEELFKDKSSIFAEEGTLAHDICELKLKKAFTETSMTSQSYNRAMNKFKKHELYKEEMQGFTDVYVDYVKEKAYASDTPPYLAVEKEVHYETYAPEGFGTADCIVIYGNQMHVIDFKYGKGVKVDATNNTQMGLYALGALEAYGFIYPVETITMSIVQPRLDNISEWQVTKEELLTWGEWVKGRAQLAYNGEGECNPGEHCTFCRAGAVCKAWAKQKLELGKYQYKVPSLLTLDEIGSILHTATDLEKWAKKVKDFALNALLDGQEVTGWKAVEGRGTREFVDEEAVVKALEEKGFDKAILYERSLLSVAKMEQTIGKKEFQEYVGVLVEKTKGKPTIAPLNDPRPVYQAGSSAQEDFK